MFARRDGINAVSISVWFIPRERKPLHDLGVGTNNPTSLTDMRRAEVTSTHHDRPSGVADFFQFTENAVDASTSDARNILKRIPARSKLADDSNGFEIEPRPLAVDAFAFVVCGAGVLAGWASANKVNCDAVSSQSFGGDCSNIVIELCTRKVSRELSAAPRVDLDRSDGDKASAVEPETPSAAGPAEEIEGEALARFPLHLSDVWRKREQRGPEFARGFRREPEALLNRHQRDVRLLAGDDCPAVHFDGHGQARHALPLFLPNANANGIFFREGE